MAANVSPTEQYWRDVLENRSTTMPTMYDACDYLNIPTVTPPTIVAGYIDGGCKWPAEAWHHFPGAYVVQIATSPLTLAGEVLDVETGAATPAEAPAWCAARRAAGLAGPVVYVELSKWATTQNEFTVQSIPQPYWWVATWNNKPEVIPGSIATQYKGPLAPGYDTSVVLPTFRWADPTTPTPPTIGDDVKYIIWSFGDGEPTWLIGGNWKTQLYTAADVAAWEAAGAITGKPLSATYVNGLPTIS
jgi:hypothetical protein